MNLKLITASASNSSAFLTISFRASSLESVSISTYSSTFPPVRLRNDALMSLPICVALTELPLTVPRVSFISFPGIKSVFTTFILPIFLSFLF